MNKVNYSPPKKSKKVVYLDRKGNPHIYGPFDLKLISLKKVLRSQEFFNNLLLTIILILGVFAFSNLMSIISDCKLLGANPNPGLTMNNSSYDKVIFLKVILEYFLISGIIFFLAWKITAKSSKRKARPTTFIFGFINGLLIGIIIGFMLGIIIGLSIGLIIELIIGLFYPHYKLF